jgi:hypothetical protein
MNDHPNWNYAEGTVSDFVTLPTQLHMGDAIEKNCLTEDSGGKPCMRICNNNQKNFGVNTGFLPGSAGVLFDFWCTFYVTIVPMAPLLASGVTPETFLSYIEAPSSAGIEFMSKNSITLRVKPHELLYIPPGFLYAFYTFEKSSGKRDWTPAMSTVCWMPLKISLTNLPPQIVAAIRKYNMDYISTKKKTMWSDRKAYLLDLLGEM